MTLPFDDEQMRARLALRRRKELPPGPATPSAVLVPLFYRGGEPYLLLTKRSERLRHHRGEISFPGGRSEPEDADLLATALREAHEEVGLAPEHVKVLGALDDMTTLKRHRVTPYVGLVPEDYPYRPDPREVALLLELPLAAFRDPRRMNHVWLPGLDGKARQVLFFDVEGQMVWGATARIIKAWLDELDAASGG